MEKEKKKKEEIVASPPLAQNNTVETNKTIINPKLIFFVLLAVVIIIIIVIIFKSITHSNIDYPILYVEGNELILWKENGKVKKTIDNNFNKSDNYHLSVAYANTTDNLFAYVNNGSLFLYNIKNDSKDKIASESSNDNGSFVFSKNDKYIVYTDEDNSIYYYDIKENKKDKIVNCDGNDISTILAISDNTFLYVIDRNDEENLYSYDLNNRKKEKIASNIFNYRLGDDGNKLLYCTSDNKDEDSTITCNIYNIKNNKTEEVAKNAYRLISLSDDYNELMYIKPASDKFDILDDDELNKDPEFKETIKTVCTYYDYSKNLCTYEQWLNDEEYTYERVTSKKEVNDSIRELANSMYLYDLYEYRNGKTEKLLSNVYSVYLADYTTRSVLYTRIDSDKIKISSLKSLDDFNDLIEERITNYYKQYNKNEVKLDTKELFEDARFNNKSLYLLNSDSKLYYVDINNKSNKLELLDSNVDSIEGFSKGLMYLLNYDDETGLYDAKVAINKEVKKVATDVMIVLKDSNNNMTVYNDCENDACKYSKYTNKLTKIIDDVYYAFPITLNKKEYYVYKNYSAKNNTYDLYKFKNGKLIQVAFDVETGYVSTNSLPTYYD